jgi:hypothetical protein
MRTVPPSQVYFAGALTAAAVALVSPSFHLPSPAPGASLDAAMLRPSRTAEQPVLDGPQALAFYRAAHHPPPLSSPAASAPRVSDDLDSAAVIPTPKPVPPPQPSQAPQPASTAQATPYPSYSALPSQSGAYGSPEAQGAPSGSTSSFQACVIARESGGNPEAQNPDSTASGLYGFLDTTWTSVTGLPGPARDYSVAQQNAAFEKLYAEAGTSPWAPSDGCLPPEAPLDLLVEGLSFTCGKGPVSP